jgi:hypothetical protein
VDELKSKPEDVASIVKKHLQYDNVIAHDGVPPFFQLLGDANMEMATNLMPLRKQWLGLEIMFVTLHIAFVLNNGSTSDELNSIWNDFLRQQPVSCLLVQCRDVLHVTS